VSRASICLDFGNNESSGQQRTDLRRAGGTSGGGVGMRGRQDAVARRALVVPPYKNERCLKLEETIRAWARLRGLLRSPPMRIRSRMRPGMINQDAPLCISTQQRQIRRNESVRPELQRVAKVANEQCVGPAGDGSSKLRASCAFQSSASRGGPNLGKESPQSRRREGTTWDGKEWESVGPHVVKWPSPAILVNDTMSTQRQKT
jgi:hypothetical protein